MGCVIFSLNEHVALFCDLYLNMLYILHIINVRLVTIVKDITYDFFISFTKNKKKIQIKVLS